MEALSSRAAIAYRSAATQPRPADLKIAFDHQIFAQQRYGGISRYFVRLAGELAAAGCAVRLAAPFHINAYVGELPADLVIGRAVAPSRWGGRAMRLANAALVGPLLAGIGPDIVHETYYAARGHTPRRARTVLTVYDMIHEKFPGSFPASDPTAALKAAAVARADHVLCISESTRRDLNAIHPGAAAKSSVTLLGFDPAPRTGTTAAGRPYLLFVGQRGGYKNFTGLLDAYAASPALRRDFDLLAAGGGAFLPGEGAAIAAHGLTTQVRQQPVDDRALQACYAGATVFIYPSLYEGFGIPPLEAMAAGTPVVAIDAGSVPEICADAAAYAPPGDTGALMAAIETVALDTGEAARLVTAGTERLRRFSWARCAADTAAVYRSLA